VAAANSREVDGGQAVGRSLPGPGQYRRQEGRRGDGDQGGGFHTWTAVMPVAPAYPLTGVAAFAVLAPPVVQFSKTVPAAVTVT
jgi:hypothetical protein